VAKIVADAGTRGTTLDARIVTRELLKLGEVARADMLKAQK
jgi:hypothetical protein